MTVDTQEFFSAIEVAERLKVSERTVRRRLAASKLKGDNLGPRGATRITRGSLIAHMNDLGIPLGDLAPAVPADGDATADADPEQGNLPVREPMATDDGHGPQS